MSELDYVEFKGSRIYMPEKKLKTLENGMFWTPSKIQRTFKTGYNAAIHFIEYAQSIGVLSDIEDSYGRYRTITAEERSLKAEIEELQERLTDALTGDINIKQMIANEKEFGVQLQGSILHMFAAGFIHHFHAQGATNFLEVGFCDPDHSEEQYTLTIQKLSGISPVTKYNLIKDATLELINAENEDEAGTAIQKVMQLTEN